MFTLLEALSAIKNKPEFGVYTRDFGTCIDYNVTMNNTFVGDTERDTLILKNLRGTCFDHDGKIISLSFDKFHNFGECAGWMESDIDFSLPHKILMKEDGSMIRVIRIGDSYRLGTRAGVTEIAMMAENFVKSQLPEYQTSFDKFVSQHISSNLTPIFEFCSRENRVVIDHPTTRLVLLGIRNNLSGQYITYDQMRQAAQEFGIEVVKDIANENSSLKDLAQSVKLWDTDEGVVVTFENGFRVKIKADKYCLAHRALDGLQFEKDVIKLILTGGLDDVLPIVGDDMKVRLTTFRDSLIRQIEKTKAICEEVYNNNKNLERKEFAEIAKSYGLLRSFLFNLHSKKPDGIIEHIIGKCSSQPSVDSIREFVGQPWNSIK